MITERRSDCPINRGVELLGDRWSLVILRDITFLGHRRFRELLTGSQEGITAPMLSTRLRGLVDAGILTKQDSARGVPGLYSLTSHGVELVPLLFELARVGTLLDPGTRSTVPELAALGNSPEGITRFMQNLRVLHGVS